MARPLRPNDPRGSAVMRSRQVAPPPTPPHRQPLMVAHGVGGAVELYPSMVVLKKGGVFGVLFELLGAHGTVLEKVIPIRNLAAVDIVRPLVLNDIIRFSYPGSAPLTGNYLADALAENALIMNVFDNREFYRLKERLEEMIESGRFDEADDETGAPRT